MSYVLFSRQKLSNLIVESIYQIIFVLNVQSLWQILQEFKPFNFYLYFVGCFDIEFHVSIFCF